MPRTRPLTPVDPNALLNWARWVLGVRTDRELAKWLEVTAPQLSKIRHGGPVKAMVLVNLPDATNVKLRDLPAQVSQTLK